MLDNISSPELSSNSVSKLLDSIITISDSLVSMLSTTFEQVSAFGQRIMSGLVGGAQYLYTDHILQSLRRLKLHLQDLVQSLDKQIELFEKVEVLSLLEKKEQALLAQLQQNQNFDRSYGWYVKQDIIPHIHKAVSLIQH